MGGGSRTYIGSGVDQRPHTGHVSRQAGLMKGGHMINGTNVSWVTLGFDNNTVIWCFCVRAHMGA